ncbi:hypothetical protein CRES_0011 [Corynebacterium resistens DSM 45100]|uniref:Helix-turn-helix domain-containing protein n=1 Tax=Corynebacterium resistens (strain DSM 45100 / JCM 12819 / GTC 2026 / SICGH 158) TaxID=662755 RepID=F8E098_CORRG|nr:helix-turn-helix domain-containing protein [Corynebacterium resistens]AEI08374.1 hypothetical protein CRES_0011 [Corynebacterium resistens DSM 45100]
MAELPTLGELIPAREFASATDSHIRTIQRLCNSGDLPAIKVGAKWFVLGNELLATSRARVLGTEGNYDGLPALEVIDEGDSNDRATLHQFE